MTEKASRSSKTNKSCARKRSALLCTLLSALILMLLPGCISSEELEFSKAEKAAQSSDYDAAIKHYNNVIERYIKTPLALQAAEEAARITHYELKDYQKAISHYKHVVLYSGDEEKRAKAQKNIAEIHFKQTLNYNQAITEYSRLLELSPSPEERVEYQLAIARCYFYLNNFFQAQVETEKVLKQARGDEIKFDALLLKANILLTTRNLSEAVNTLKMIIEKYPKRAQEENVALTLVVTYEEQKNFQMAIETLEAMKETYPQKSFIEKRIKGLKERQSHLPGARGWRK